MASKIFSFGKKIIPLSVKHYFSKLYYTSNSLFKYGTIDFFRAIEIETLTKCNRKCNYCPNSKYDRGEHYMDENLFKKIINELAEIDYNGRISPHFYGEPLLDLRLPDLLEYTRERLPDAYIVLYTNGDFMTKQMFDLLISKGVDCFLITQHMGVASETFKQTLRSLNRDERKKITLQIFNENSKLSNRGGLVKPKITEKLKLCKFPATTVVVDYNGNVVLCCNDYFSTIKFGNLNSEKLVDVWKKSSYKKLRKDISAGKFELDICKKCSN